MSKEKFSIGSETVIGMVHCLPLPTTAGFDGDYQKILDRAVQDAVTLEKAGVDAVIVENMGDTPFSALLNKAQLAALTAATLAVKNAVNIPVGVDAAFNYPSSGICGYGDFYRWSHQSMRKKMYGISQSDGKRGHQSFGRCAGETCAYGTSIYYTRAVSERSSGQRSGWNYRNGNPDWRGNTAGSDQASKKCSKSAGICRKRCESREYQRSAADCRWCDHRIQPERRRDYQQSDFL